MTETRLFQVLRYEYTGVDENGYATEELKLLGETWAASEQEALLNVRYRMLHNKSRNCLRRMNKDIANRYKVRLVQKQR